jgi:RND superfamily putative drug exporter
VLTTLANALIRRRRIILVAALVWFLVAGAIGGGVAKHLSTGGFNDPAAASTKAGNLLRDRFHAGNPQALLVVTAKGARSVDDPQVAAQAQSLAAGLSREPNVAQVTSYWSLGQAPPLKSKDGHQALILARLTGTDDQVSKQVKPLVSRYQVDNSVINVKMGGQAQVFNQVGSTIQKDLARAELYTFIPTLLLLILVFGSAMASLVPLVVAGLAVVSTFLALRVVASLTDVSVFALNLTTALGLALAIDFGLFMVSRYREEMRLGLPPQEAIVRTVQTAGRTVIFAASTVSISLAVLLVFPMYFLKSFAYAGIAVVLLAAVGAVIVLPAILAALDTRINLGTLWHHTPKEVGQGFWHRLAMIVMRRPVIIGGSVIAVLLVLGSPFLRVTFGLPDDRVLPASATARQAQTAIRVNFSGNEASALEVVAPTAHASPATITGYAETISTLSGVGRVDAITGSFIAGRQVAPPNPASVRFVGPGGTGTWLSVVPTVEPESPKAEALVKTIRHLPAPFPTLVGGQSAQLVDSKASLFGRLPLAGGLIALVTITVLFLMTGSVLVPFKALVLNLLSLTATFGAMVWIFQEGHLSHLLSFTATGTIDTTTPILMFCVAFGISMDYEVFLLSRIKEEHDRTGDNVASVATGLEHTGRIVTAAALIQAVVFAAFGTSHVAFIKLFGVGLAMAVLVDATLVRAALVPAFMRLAGNANWWAPRPLQRLYHRIGLSETEGERVPAAAGLRPEPRYEEVA